MVEEIQHIKKINKNKKTSDFKNNKYISEDEFTNFKELLPIGLAIISQEGRIVDLNDFLLKIMGYDSKKELIGKRFSFVIVEDDGKFKWVEQVTNTHVVCYTNGQYLRLQNDLIKLLGYTDYFLIFYLNIQNNQPFLHNLLSLF